MARTSSIHYQFCDPISDLGDFSAQQADTPLGYRCSQAIFGSLLLNYPAEFL
jgi:hypothetical protein